MNIFYKDNTELRKEFFEFIKGKNRPKSARECGEKILDMLDRHRAEINRPKFTGQIMKLIIAHNVDRAYKVFNLGIPNREPRTWVVYAYRYLLALIAVVAAITLLN